jgi:hypothetical protein
VNEVETRALRARPVLALNSGFAAAQQVVGYCIAGLDTVDFRRIASYYHSV